MYLSISAVAKSGQEVDQNKE